jgi:DNA polymerase III subunit delta'
MIFKWNRSSWNLAWTTNSLPAALLLAGPAGVGKAVFAQALAQAALCTARTATHEACGTCHGCRLFLAGAHPDLRLLEALPPEDAAAEAAGTASTAQTRVIGVERVRDLRDFTEMSSHLGGRKVIVINPADRLHPSAANALLKTLEEPTPGTLFVLVSARPQQLLPTLRSRCFRLDFRVPDGADALDWLRAQGIEDAETVLAHVGGAPLAAAELARSSFWRRRQDIARLLASPHATAGELARTIDPEEMASFCGLLYKWCADLLSLRLAGRVRYNPDYAKSLSQLAVNFDVLRLQRFIKELTEVLRYLEHPLNQRLVCEKMALGYTRALAAEEH